MTEDDGGFFAPAAARDTPSRGGRRDGVAAVSRATAGGRRTLAVLGAVVALAALAVPLVVELPDVAPPVLGAGEGDVLAVYPVVDRALGTPDVEVPADVRAQHEALWGAWLAVVPATWAHRVDRFALATDGPRGALAWMSAVREHRTLVLDPVDAPTPDTPGLTRTFVHELAHLVVMQDGEPSRLRADVLPVSLLDDGCAGRVLVDTCVLPGSLLGRFAERFWDDAELAAAARDATDPDPGLSVLARYQAQAGRYATAYAASNPDEDLAESLTAAVLGEGVPPGSTAAEKLAFLEADPAFAGLVAELRATVTIGR